MARSQLVIRYLLMVGIPLGIVLIVLDAGKGLTAPPPVAGNWRLATAAAAPVVAASCPLEPLFGSSGAFTLGQAGRFLTMGAAHTLYGRIEGNAVRLESDPPAGPFVTARLVRTPAEILLEGIAGGTGPQACVPASFTARLVASATNTPPSTGSH